MKDLGDVPSTFEAFYDQLQAGLNMGLAGIPWWTTDIGGFMTDDVNDPDFQQLLIRWYEFAVYSAVLRMHGDRGPYNIPMLDDRDFGGGCLHTGQTIHADAPIDSIPVFKRKQLSKKKKPTV